MEREPCFVCGASAILINSENEWTAKKSLESNLNKIFLLRKVLQVPSIQLECQLEECGSNPENWIRLCAQCTQLIQTARKLYQEIKKIEEKLEKVEKQILEPLKALILTKPDRGKVNYQNYTEFQHQIRSFVKSKDYHHLDENRQDKPDFLEGDKQAKYLETQKHSTKILIVIETPFQEAGVKEEVVSPSPSQSPPVSPAAEDDDSSDDHDTTMEPPPVEEPVYLCDHCGQKFDTESLLTLHKKELHKVHSFRCSLCGLGFWRTRQLQRHLLSKHKEDPITIKMQEETGLFYRKCKVIGCPARFMMQFEETRHMTKVHTEGIGEGEIENDGKTYKCRICGRGFWARFECWRHERIHEVKGKVRHVKWRPEEEISQDESCCLDKRFKCGECGKSWDKVRNWGEHVWRKHEGGRDIPCPEETCGMVFKAGGDGGTGSLDEFESHWNMEHKVRVKWKPKKGAQKRRIIKVRVGVFVCEICGEDMGTYKKLYNHNHRKRGHKEEDGKEERVGVTCEICGKKMKNKKYLSTHVKHVHERKFELKCDVCGLGMWGEKDLKRHLLVKHKGEEAARRLGEEGVEVRRCEVRGCEFTCLREGQMGKHKEKWHGGKGEGEGMEKRFKCGVCGMGFWVKAKCVVHERAHEERDERRKGFGFECQVCGKRFKRRDNLKVHGLRVHKIGGYI